MKPVFLIGYMGCGKTTLGEALAVVTGLPFIDMDERIERSCGKSIPEIFDEMGEKGFRTMESETLSELAAMTDVIVGCGGGTACNDENMALMNRAGITVWLTTSPERITARLLLPDQKSKRPKVLHLPDEEVLPFVRQELQVREPYYSQAQLHFDSTDIETAAATRRTARRLAAVLESFQTGGSH